MQSSNGEPNCPDPPSARPTIPFDYGQQPRNRVGGYEWGQHHQAYIRYCAKQAGLYDRQITEKERLRQAMEACGMRNLNKFQRNRKRWNEGESPIPMAYLEFIGANLELLREAVALDVKAWEEALERAKFPRHFGVRLIPTVYCTRSIPDGFTEDEAVAYVQGFQNTHPNIQGCCINWPGLKAIYVWYEKPPTYRYWRPTMVVKDGQIHFSDDGSLEGVAYVGRPRR